ncbi:M4 family metallopeptidase [Nocardioides speluncae]|uniref:M4 family metallopeptidase n=1 Tax=Nocardioides speluncae TaxID=2670337 RepID=UPI00137B59C9|nr:M4 family metallopeptidase [Nocardioides speluncae]
MKFLKQGVCLALLGGLAAVPALQATAQSGAPAADDSLVAQIREEADGAVKISSEKATGRITFVRASAENSDLMPSKAGKGDPVAKATSYVRKYAAAFGAKADQLSQQSVRKNGHGWTVSFAQSYKGIPVWGTQLRAHVDADGQLTSVNGEAAPVSGLDTTPRLSETEAGERAVRMVKADPPDSQDRGKVNTSGLKAKATELYVYRTGLIKGQAGGKTGLVYQVEVTNERNIRDVVLVAADSGKVVNRYSMIHNELDRKLYEVSRETEPVWEEGDPLPGTLNADQESLVRSTGDSYWFFKNTFNRDSYTGDGTTMLTVNNDPTISCPNANWNGVTTNYCDGVSSDDVVAHEWGHAYTEYTHGLIYQYQPGALNEAYSDIWGETVDLLNGRLDEGEGDINAKRPAGQCSTHSPATPLLTINSPAPIARDCDTAGAAFGPQLTGTGVTGDLVKGLDADEDGDGDPNPFDLEGSTFDGCSPLTNAADVAGKVVLLNRGLCGFEVKARNGQAAGAIAVVIANRDPAVFPMSGDAQPDPTISTVMINRTDWEAINTATGTVNVTMKDASGDRVDSFRWLMGEKSDAFGGAIRDMWNPTCYGHPGKVSDAEYFCGTGDAGGVHSNSGVPNHGYALLVDGGTYNGITVPAVGFTKAAAIYWRAQNEYQTPASGFADHADALAASCADLTGKRINEPTTEPNTYQPSQLKIGAADCAAVEQMAKAVELRKDPAQCNYQPLLDPNAPALCGPGTAEDVVYEEDFEDGLTGWTTSGENPFGGPTKDWKTDSEMPGTNNTIGAQGPAPDFGQCDGSTSDFSSVNYLTSGDIVVGTAEGMNPRLSFRHYVATELGFDGGTVQISKNGGAFATVPAAAYLFNEPGKFTSAAGGNTNPLAGQDGFTGTDGGKVTGSWGESQIDLAAAGVAAGDTIKLRLAVGRDGCGGNDGWYVDDIKIALCEIAATVTGTHVPEPSKFGTASKLNVKVAGPSGSDVPSGTVVVKKGSSTLGTVTLSATGTGSLTLPKTLAVGTNTLTLNYSGDANYDAATGTAKATVVKATSKTTATVKPTSVKKGNKFVVTAKVTATGVTPTGSVKIFKGTRLLASGKLVGGTVKITVGTGSLSVGSHKLTVKYAGSTTVAASQGSVTIKVTR